MRHPLIVKEIASRTALWSLLGAAAGAATLLLGGTRRRLLRRRAKKSLRQLSQLLGTAQRMLNQL